MMNMTDFIELARMNREAYEDYGIISAEYDPLSEQYKVQVARNSFKDIAAGTYVTTSPRNDYLQLQFEYKGVKFFTLITLAEYEKDFKQWLNPEIEEVSLSGTEYERGMKATNHKQADFM